MSKAFDKFKNTFTDVEPLSELVIVLSISSNAANSVECLARNPY